MAGRNVGLTPVEALPSATVLAAKFFSPVGKRADLVLLRANPLENIRNVSQVDGVVASGRYFGPDDISALNACRAPVAR